MSEFNQLIICEKKIVKVMDVDEELIKVYFKLPKLPNETSYNVIHLYSIPQFGKNSFTLKNCNSILKNMGNVGEIYAEAFAITINHLYMHIYQSSNEKCIGYYDTFNILGARNLGKRIDGKTDVFVIKTLSCQNYDCAVLHFFRLSIREDKSFIDKICRTINRNSEKAKSTIITRFSNILDDQAFINKGRYEKEIEALTHCFSQIEDAMKVLNDSIQQRKNIEKRYKDCGFKSLKQIGTILRRAGGLSNEEIKDVIQKIRHSFNIIVAK
ncbi:hypothetical protein HZS_2880 [Henneguya salminicola]|nr:hypothetical protein HZS_2880 [Henneguya salminicola]